MIIDLSRVQADVDANTSVAGSVNTLVQGLADQIRALAPTQAAINALADKVEATNAALTAAVTNNTPVADVPAATPADVTVTPVDPNAAPVQ